MRARSRALVVVTIAATVLYVAASLIQSPPPADRASGTEVVRYFVDHGGRVRWVVFFATVTLALVTTMIALVRERLPAPHGTMFFAGGITLVSTSMIFYWFLGGLAMHPRALDPASARTLLDIANYYGPVLIAATLVMVTPTVILAWNGVLPKWYGVLAAVLLVEQAIETITVFGRGGFTEPGGAMNLKLGATLFLVWLLATGLLAARLPVLATYGGAGGRQASEAPGD